MQYLLKLEEAAMCLLGIAGISQLHIHLSWWLYIILFFSPDAGMAGYLITPSIGAFTYNLFHHKAVAVIFILTGWYLVNSYLELAGLLLFAHASFDRVFGYGLKYSDSFKHTSLGWLK